MQAPDLRDLKSTLITPEQGLAGRTVVTLYKDREDNFWIGGYRKSNQLFGTSVVVAF